MVIRWEYPLYLTVLLFFSVACGNSNPVTSPLVPLVTETATISVSGTQITIRGVIQKGSLSEFNTILDANSAVTTVVLENVPGTDDTNASFGIGRRIRAEGLRTHIPADGVVASGGTDIFVRGVIRTAGEGAYIGVHSWISDGTRGIDLPNSNLLHQPFITYYQEMGLPSDFYWFAVRSASPEIVHWMTDTEITQFNLIATQAP